MACAPIYNIYKFDLSLHPNVLLLLSIFGMEVRCCSIISTAIRYLMMQIWLSLVNDTGIHPASCRATYALSFDAYKGCMNDSLKDLNETLKFGVQSWSIKEPWHHIVPSPLNKGSQFQPFHTSTTTLSLWFNQIHTNLTVL